MTLGYIHNYIPPRPSGQFIGVLFGIGIEPMEILVRVPVAAASVVMVSGSFCPFIIEIGWLVFVSAVGIAMAVIASMFGTVVNDIMPFTLIAGSVPDSAIACSSEVNPYVFERNHLDKIEWLLNGKPIAVRSMDISKDKGLRAYKSKVLTCLLYRFILLLII